EISFFTWRVSRVRDVFHSQVAEMQNPILYSFTRDQGRMDLKPICRLKEHISKKSDGEVDDVKQFGFDDMLRTPSALREGESALPPQRPEFSGSDDSA
ncbi:MAG: hypothetical protein QF440_06640, partial [Candidatus Thalassarchaeaceae archaeon]|nr:hypothetical protein [Candidatus Thalassarchaeaceae archaeon]